MFQKTGLMTDNSATINKKYLEDGYALKEIENFKRFYTLSNWGVKSTNNRGFVF